MTQIGMVHGRFQPFHLGHLEYLEQVAVQVDVLIIGITNPIGTSAPQPEDDHRHLPASNPYTFVERARMIAASTTHLSPLRLTVPFDVQEPSSWGFLGLEVVQYVSMLEEWDQAKVRSFRDFGYEVVELRAERRTSATEIRERLSRGLPIDGLVPAGARAILGEIAARPRR